MFIEFQGQSFFYGFSLIRIFKLENLIAQPIFIGHSLILNRIIKRKRFIWYTLRYFLLI